MIRYTNVLFCLVLVVSFILVPFYPQANMLAIIAILGWAGTQIIVNGIESATDLIDELLKKK